MEFREVQELIKLISKTNLTEFKMKDGEFELSIRTDKFTKGGVQMPAAPQSMVSVPSAPLMQAPSFQAAPSSPPAAAPVAEKSAADAAPAAPAAENYIEVRSPMVGTFYRSASPEKGPYVKIGDAVSQGDVVCIIEAMKLFNEIEAEVSGRVVKILVEDAQPVEYDQVLFLLDPKG
jgi:acetyl-CoA carboxylase biotin carboxyl carrier protein